ncbi:MAG: GldG family protein [Candidatus Cloacimonetes bacterium]|nr:GldG family protein [Candidatus Cloacimonadota bacterium]
MKRSNLFNIIVFVAIIIFVNLVSRSLFTRIDFSRGKIYSLSKSSKEAVKNLEDRLVVKAYFSKNLPGEIADARRFTQDLLSEYQAYSHGKLRFEFIGPADEDKLKEEAQKNQISPFTMRVPENDQLVIREVYLGLSFLYRDKVETIPLVQNTRGLEYDITSSIKKISAIGLKKIALYEVEDITPPSPMMPNAGDKYKTVRQLISDSYELTTTDLFSEVESSVSTLIVTGVEDSLSEEQLYNLDQFVMKGGNLLLFQDKIRADVQNQKAEKINSNLFDLMRSYGIKIKNNIVTDAKCGAVQVQRQQGFFRINTPINYPFFPIIHNVNKDNIIVKNLDQMQLIFASEIDTVRMSPDLNFEPLLFTSSNSGEIKEPRLDISVMKFMNQKLEDMYNDPPKIVSGIYSGLFKSYFADNPSYPDVFPDNSEAKILLVTDSEFIDDNGGAGVKGNLDFVLNSVDYMASDATLIEIRSRETEYKPLKEISSGAKKMTRWLNILLPSILLILLGVSIYRKEIARRKVIGELYE